MTPKDPFTRDIKIGEDWTIPNANGVGRRVIVQGAVWTVPVVAFATNASAAAASPTAPTLEFTQPSYSGTACNDIVGVKVQLTTDGSTPAGAGEPITVTLSDGYMFSGGGTTYSANTLGDGTITLPDIIVPAGGGGSVFSAFSGSLTDTAPVDAPILTTAYQSVSGAAGTPQTNVPSGSTAVGYSSFLAPNGDLFYGNKRIAQNVTSASAEHDENTSAATDVITYISNGKVFISTNGAVPPGTGTAVPSGSTVVGYASYLAPNGDLYYGGSPLASNVTSGIAAHNEYSNPAKDIITYVKGVCA